MNRKPKIVPALKIFLFEISCSKLSCFHSPKPSCSIGTLEELHLGEREMEAAVAIAEETRSQVKVAGEGKEKAAVALLHRRNRIQVSPSFLAFLRSIGSWFRYSRTWPPLGRRLAGRSHEEFRAILLNNRGLVSSPPLDRPVAEFFERSVKALDVCNAIWDGIEQVWQWQKYLEIILVALDHRQRAIGGALPPAPCFPLSLGLWHAVVGMQRQRQWRHASSIGGGFSGNPLFSPVLASRSPNLLDFHEDLVSFEAASKPLAEEMQAITKGLEKVELELTASENDGPVSEVFCKVLASRSPNLLDFHEDLVSFEAASKIQLKPLAEEMQAITKGLEKVELELTASENNGPVSEVFCKLMLYRELEGSGFVTGTICCN